MYSGRTGVLGPTVELGIWQDLPQVGKQQMKEQQSRVIQEESRGYWWKVGEGGLEKKVPFSPVIADN